MRPNVRSPIIPLDFDLNIRAVRKELMIDYQEAAIYVVSPDDPNIFINITNKIKEAILAIIQGSDGDITDITNCQVTIEGVGTFVVSQFLKILYQSQVTAIPAPNLGNIAFRSYTYDNKSVGIYNDKVAIIGFEQSPNGCIPIKKNGMIRWISETDLQKPDEYKPNRYGVHMIDPVYSDPDLPGIITLLEDAPIQRTANLSTRAEVHFPEKISTDYCSIKWLINTIDEENILVAFRGNMIWAFANDAYLGRNMIAIYEFETFDRGATWFGKRQTYGNRLGSDEYVTSKELYNNFFTKPETIDMLSWDYDIDENDLLEPNPGNPSEGDIGELNGGCDCTGLVPATDAQVDSLLWDLDFGDENPADDVVLAESEDIQDLFKNIDTGGNN